MLKSYHSVIRFTETSPEQLYSFYMNQEMHREATGDSKGKIVDKHGTAFELFGGFCSGSNVYLEKGRTIVQRWRASNWHPEESDSIVTIHFEPEGEETLLYLTHANIPEKYASGLKKGWRAVYWNKWKKYLKQ